MSVGLAAANLNVILWYRGFWARYDSGRAKGQHVLYSEIQSYQTYALSGDGSSSICQIKVTLFISAEWYISHKAYRVCFTLVDLKSLFA